MHACMHEYPSWTHRQLSRLLPHAWLHAGNHSCKKACMKDPLGLLEHLGQIYESILSVPFAQWPEHACTTAFFPACKKECTRHLVTRAGCPNCLQVLKPLLSANFDVGPFALTACRIRDAGQTSRQMGERGALVQLPARHQPRTECSPTEFLYPIKGSFPFC